MNLNLPILDQVANCQNLLIAGMGGGYDLFCGLPIYFELRQRGQTVHLANFSFSDVVNFSSGKHLTSTLVGVEPNYEHIMPYFPELHLVKWFKEKRHEDITIWCFQKTGAAPLLENYRVLCQFLNIDGILLIDGGVDSLVRGDETQTATLIEDATSLFAVNELSDLPVRLLACLGFGVEQDLTYAQILENIATLTQANGFWGTCSLLPQMWAYQAYEDAVLYVQSQPVQDPSVINSSIISSARGMFGNYHLTEKTKGSRLEISPLMSVYWFFDLPTVAAHNLYLPQLGHSHTFMEALQAYLSVRKKLDIRRDRQLSTHKSEFVRE